MLASINVQACYAVKNKPKKFQGGGGGRRFQTLRKDLLTLAEKWGIFFHKIVNFW